MPKQFFKSSVGVSIIHVFGSVSRGVDLRNGFEPTQLAGNSEADNIQRQLAAAKDFQRLGSMHLANEQSRVEVVDYYLYKGPNAAKLLEEENAFDSALLPGEGVTEEEKHPAENPRPAYCVLALGLEACPAKATTQSAVASSITSEGGTVSAAINPNGLATHYFVEYGTTEAYGKTTTATAVPNANGTQNVTAVLNGLTECTIYYYRAVAENKANEEEKRPGLGGDETFATECKGTARVRVSVVKKEDEGLTGSWNFVEYFKAQVGTLDFDPRAGCNEHRAEEEGGCLEMEIESMSREIPEAFEQTTGTVVPSRAATKLGAWMWPGYERDFYLEFDIDWKAIYEEYPLKPGKELVRDTYEFEVKWYAKP